MESSNTTLCAQSGGCIYPSRITVLILSVFLISDFCFASIDANKIYRSLQARVRQVQHFVADVTVEVNIESMKVPPARGELNVRYPGSIEFSSRNLTFIPKSGWQISPFIILQRQDFLVLDGGRDGLKSTLRLFPEHDTGEVLAAKLLVDLRDTVVTNAEVSTRSTGTISLAISYGAYRQLHLPERLIMNFSVLPISIPRTLTGDIASSQPNRPKDSPTEGSVTITFNRYTILKR